MRNLVPEIVLRNYKNNDLDKRFNGYCLYLDISGFTNMTVKLMKHGKQGAEILSSSINRIFDEAIDIIYKNRGFIAIFEGDSFTAIFQDDKASISNIFKSAQQIQSLFEKKGELKTKFGDYRLNFNMGLSYGKNEMKIIKNQNQNSFYFRGESINKALHAESLSKDNEIVFSENILKRMNNSLEVKYKNANEGYYRIKDIKIIMNSEIDIQNSNSKYRNLIKDFYPKKIINKKFRGEFRNVVTCFIELQIDSDFNENIKKIINTTHKYGGYFNNISCRKNAGVILSYFGTPIMRENLTTRAADFTLSLKEKMNSKIGMTYGRVFTGFRGGRKRIDFTCLGTEVNLAARLMRLANKKQILLSNNTYKNITSPYEIQNMENRDLKNKIKIYELKDKLPAFAPSFFRGEFVGRNKELRKLESNLKFNNKSPKIIHVAGDAGIGKSRLVTKLRKKTNNKYHWFYFPCNEIVKKSFNPFINFLKNYFHQSLNGTKEENRKKFNQKINLLIKNTKNKKIKKELKRTIPYLRALLNIHKNDSEYNKAKPESRHKNILYALENLIKAESLNKPLILELDDAQWIDEDSQKAIKHIMDNSEGFPYILIYESRFNEDGSIFKFGIDEIKEKVFKIEQFNKDDTKKIITNILDKNISSKLVNTVWQKSEGNPFYTEQISLYIKENGLIEKDLGPDDKGFEIPDKINNVIIARLDRLTERLKEIVQTASVLGRKFMINILSEMLKDIDIEKEVRKIQKKNIWQPISEIRYIFKHALIRETAYRMQLDDRLKKLHNLAAKTIEKLYDNNPESVYGDLAYHHEKAENYKQSKEYFKKAGKQAKQNYQNERALDYFNKLLNSNKFNLTEKEKVNSYINLIELHKSIGNINRIDKMIDTPINLAKKINDNESLMKLYVYKAIVYGGLGNYDRYFEFINKQLELAKKEDNKKQMAKAYNNLAMGNNFQGNFDKSIEFSKKGIEIIQRNNLDEILYNLYFVLALTYFKKQNFKKFKKYIDKHKKLARKDNNRWELIKSYSNLGIYYYQIQDYDNSKIYLEKCRDLSKEIGSIEYQIISQNNLSEIYIEEGKYEKALKMLKNQLKHANRTQNSRIKIFAKYNMGKLEYQKKNFKKAIEKLNIALSMAKKANLKRLLAEILMVRVKTNFSLSKYKKAVNDIKKNRKYAEELKRSDMLKYLEIYEKNIEFENTKTANIRVKEVVEPLEQMLDGIEDDEILADVKYELADMYHRVGDDGKALKYRKEAAEKYSELKEEIPKIKYKNRLKDLEEIL